jgi:thioredoxin reductase (NADPH)
MQIGLKIETYTRVVGIEREGDGFVVRCRRNVRGVLMVEEQVWRARRVILSTGGTERANLLGIAGEDLPHVSHYFQDPHSYFGREVLIVGGRNSAVEAALRCYRAGARVKFAYRREGVDAKDIKYWLYPEFSSLVKSGAIQGYFNCSPVTIGERDVLLRRTDGGEERVSADFVLLMTGYVADLGLAQLVGVGLTGDQDLPVYDVETMETNVPGVYVIGTAIAGTQRRYKVFLENCHAHVERVVRHLMGKGGHVEERVYERPES